MLLNTKLTFFGRNQFLNDEIFFLPKMAKWRNRFEIYGGVEILAASTNCERAFSRMGWMVSARRASITATNADKRLTLCNQLPQKRRLLELCRERKIKRTKLNEDLFK